MASVVYHDVIRALMNKELDLDTDDIRCKLLMVTTTCDTEIDAVNLADFTTLGESDDTGYTEYTFTTESVSDDDTNDRAVFDAEDASFASLNGNGSNDYQGVLIYQRVDGTPANDVAIVFVEFSNQPIDKGASQIDVPWAAAGILLGQQG